MIVNKVSLVKTSFLVAVLLLLTIASVHAQEDLPQNLIKDINFEQNLNAQLPLHLTFTDSSGQVVRLGDYFGDKPVILTLGYYECPMLCSLVRNSMFESLKELDFTIGDEFEVLVVSIDPRETPDVAEMKRRASIIEYERSTSDDGWNFLVGEEEAISQLATVIGFNYAYDERIDQYVHPSGILILTPEGRISRYFYGIDYPPSDLRLGLVEAASNKIGSFTDQLLLTCYQYDPISGAYTLEIMNILRIVGVVTVLLIGGALWFMLRGDKNRGLPQSV